MTTMGAIKAKTKVYGFNKVNFDFPRWHTYEWENWDILDAALRSVGAIGSTGIWQNSTQYLEGTRVTDTDDSITYVALITHTSPPTGTFKDYRTAFPGQWRPITAVPYYRGEFAYPVDYYPGDIVKQGYVYRLSTARGMSTVDSFVDGAYWTTVFDATATIVAVDQAGVYAQQVTDLYEDFLSRYLGPYSSNPTVDALGHPVQIGAIYWNTAINRFRVYRSAGVWDEMIGEAPQDGQQYARQNGVWAQVIAGAQVGTEPPVSPLLNSFWFESDSGRLFIRYYDGNSTQWVQIGGGGGGGTSIDAVMKTGDTMTGPLILSAPPSLPMGAANKQYVDAQITAIPQPSVFTKTESDARYVNITGDTMTANLEMPGAQVYRIDGYGTVYLGTNAANNWYLQRAPSNGWLYFNYTAGGAAKTPMYMSTNGDFVMEWAGDWMSNILAAKAPLANPQFSGDIRIRGSSPTIYLRDTDHYGAYIHCNSHVVYLIRMDPDSFSAPAQPNGRYPFTSNLINGDFIASGNVGAYSDERLKKNIRPITNALDAVLKMEGVWFEKIETGDPGAGVIAQKLRNVAPELVKEDKDGYLSVDYGNLAAYFIEAIKELAKR